MKKIAKRFENVEIFKEAYTQKVENNILFLNSVFADVYDETFHYEVKKLNENEIEIVAFSNDEFDKYNAYLSKITINVENITNEFFNNLFEI